MGQTNARRVEMQEGAYPFQGTNLAAAMLELARLLFGANLWTTVTRATSAPNLGYITQIDYFADAAKTVRVARETLTRDATTNRITAVTAIYYNHNTDGSEDSRVTHTLTRTGTDFDRITANALPFTTTEGQGT